MAIPTNKEELIKYIESSYQKLRPEFDDIPSDLIHEKSMEGQAKNTKMTVHNLVSYLLGWGEMMLDWDRSFVATGKIPDFQTSNYGELAQRFYTKYASESYDDLLARLDKTVNKIVKMLGKKSNADLYEKAWHTTKSSAKDYTFGRLVQFNTSSPYRNARNRIRKWKKEKELR